MSTYDVQLVERREIADGTMSFQFTWPDGFDFRAGQAVELILPEVGGHAFSLVSPPSDRVLVIATRMRDSAYKRALRDLPIGASAKLDGPFGSLTLHRSPARDAVFVAGGIGITPFMSILRQAARTRFLQRIVLVYSNRRPRDAAFLDELRALDAADERFTLVTTMTEAGGRMVDAAMIGDAMKGLAAPVVYVAGPPAMVEAMKGVLDKAGVDDTDVRSEEFFGYETAQLKDEAHRAQPA